MEIATGKVADACYPRHRNGEFLAFLKQFAKAHSRQKLHIVCDNYGSHKHPNVNAWLAKSPRITLHFIPTSGGLNMVSGSASSNATASAAAASRLCAT